MATLHLISGLPCSGKTTYSLALRDREGGVHLCLDYWLITLFGKYSIEQTGKEEHTRRVLACRALMWDLCDELLRKGADVILDDGFFLREHRMQCIKRGKEVGAAAVIHYLDIVEAVLRSRLTARNAALPEFNFVIDPNLLESFGRMYEPPGEHEGAALVIHRG